MTKNRELTYLSVFFISLLSFYWGLIVFLDNTNITTGNGLYKAVEAHMMGEGKRFSFDSGGILYIPMMAVLCKIIPDSFVSFYGEYFDGFLTYRKFSMINGFFAAASGVVVFRSAFLLYQSVFKSIIISCIHCCSGVFIIAAIISEDIMPAYFFFILSFYFVLKYLCDTQKLRKHLSMATVSIFLMMNLHWTLFPPTAVAFFCAAIYLLKEKQISFRFVFEQIFFFLLLVVTFFIIIKIFASLMNRPMNLKWWSILYPSKASVSGIYSQFQWEKLDRFFVGFGSALFDCSNVMGFSYSTLTFYSLFACIFSFFIYVFSSVILMRNLKDSPQGIFISIFTLAVVFVSQSQNIYVSPNEVQFQLQPMFLLTGYLLVCFNKFSFLWRSISAVIPFILFATNFLNLLPERHLDTNAVVSYKEFRKKFPRETTQLIHLGYEGFAGWLIVIEHKDGWWPEFLEENISLNAPFVFEPGISKEKALSYNINIINKAYKDGKRLIATTPWIVPENLLQLRTQSVPLDAINYLSDGLIRTYKIKETHHLKWGDFVEIEPIDPIYE